MKISKLLVFVSLTIGSYSYAHPNDPRVTIELDQQSAVNAGQISIAFQLVDIEARKVLTSNDLVVSHEKILHAFFYDPALKEFRHEHPIFKKGMWHVSTNLSVSGDYWFWTQGQIALDKADFSASTRQLVRNGSATNPIPSALGDVRIGVDGISRVTADNSVLRAGKMAMLNLHFSRTDNTPTQITPYLGATAHVVAVTLDGDSLLHVHPMAAGNTDMMIHTEFPTAGDYRLWVQFIDGGIMRIIPLSVKVAP